MMSAQAPVFPCFLFSSTFSIVERRDLVVFLEVVASTRDIQLKVFDFVFGVAPIIFICFLISTPSHK